MGGAVGLGREGGPMVGPQINWVDGASLNCHWAALKEGAEVDSKVAINQVSKLPSFRKVTNS